MFKRDDFPLLRQHDVIYLDNAATAQKPQKVIDALVDFYTNANANPGRSVYQLGEKATQLYEDARAKVAQFFNVEPNEIIFTKNATEGINFVAQAWARNHLKKGDVIVLTELEHHANLLPWQRVAHQTGAEIKYIPVDKEGVLDLAHLDQIITPKTKIVSITHSSNALGNQVDVAPIIKAAHDVGALVLVDGCQTAGHQIIDLKKMGTDFFVFSPHKIGAPTGIGVLYIARKLHDEVEPYNVGGGIVEQATYKQATFLPSPQKFEAGTVPVAQAAGLAAALEYLESHGVEKIRAHEIMLTNYAIEQLATLSCVQLLGPLEQLKKEGHMISFVIENMHAHDVAAYLDSKGIAVRAGHFCAQPLAKKIGYDAAVRASFFGYNTMQEVDQLVKALQALCS